MTTTRVKKDTNYSVIHNTPINDKSLSCESLGVITYLLSKPDNWIVQNHEIRQRFDIGRDKTARIFKELTSAGYMRREQIRTDSGQWEWDTTINEHGTIDVKSDNGTIDVKPVDGKTNGGKHVDIVSTELPSTEKEGSPEKSQTSSTEKTKPPIKAATKNKKVIPEKPKKEIHPAIIAYRDTVEKYPPKGTWPKIELVVGDNLDKWQVAIKTTLENWSGDFSPPINRFIEVFNCDADYEKFKAWKWPEEHNGKKNGNLGQRNIAPGQAQLWSNLF